MQTNGRGGEKCNKNNAHRPSNLKLASLKLLRKTGSCYSGQDIMCSELILKHNTLAIM
jgi:hypothetical protein